MVKDDLRRMATAIEARYVDNSSYLVPDEVFVPGSVFARRYGVDPEVIRLWNGLPQDKRPTYGLRRHEKEFTEAEQNLWQQIEQTAGDRLSYYQNWERNRSLDFGVLTTPVAYLVRVPRDPFSEDFAGRYRYGTPRVNRGWADCWMLASNGPDGDADIAPEYVEVQDDRSAWLHVAYPFQEAPQPLQNFLYDPTNGALSSGDIVRFGP